MLIAGRIPAINMKDQNKLLVSNWDFHSTFNRGAPAFTNPECPHPATST
jgi:hypothetical protein